MDDNDAIDNDDECAKKEDVALLETKEGLTATHAARMATRESKRIAAEVRLKATYENANKYQAKFHRLFTVSLPPDEDYNLSQNVHEEVFITSSSPSDSILFPKSSDNLLIQAVVNPSFLGHSMSPSICWKVKPTLVSSGSQVHRLIYMTVSKTYDCNESMHSQGDL